MTTEEYQAVLEKQMAMTPVTWRTLQQHGVTESTRLVVDLFFFAQNAESASALAQALRSRFGTDPEVRRSDKVVAIEAQHPIQSFTLDSLFALMREMCALGYQHQCEFDGWGAQVPTSAKSPRPWWKFW